jgi:hypothetical protein
MKKVVGGKSPVEGVTETIATLLKLVDVVEALAKAPRPAVEWASKLRATGMLGGRIPNPVDRIGQKGLERRVAGLRQAIEAVFPADGEGRIGLLTEVERLDSAVKAAGTMPLTKRRAAHARIDDRLDAMERALIDAMLPED